MPEGRPECTEAEAAESRVVVPVIEERLDVRKRAIETGRVRIRKVVRECEVVVDEPLSVETVEVRRVPVNRPVDGPIPDRREGDTLIVSVVEEELVVQRRLVLKEELHITKRRSEAHRPRRVTLRAEEATVERVPAGAGEETIRE